MPRVRPEYTGKYRLEPDEFYTAMYYAYGYERLKKAVELERLGGMTVEPLRAVTYGQDRKNTSAVSKPTEAQAMRLANISIQRRAKIQKIEEAAREAASGAGEAFRKCLLYGVTHKGCTYHWLKINMDMPAQRDMYYARRRRFYWILNQKIQ